MDLKYIIREPKEIHPNTTILFMLHGYGSNEDDLFSFEPDLPQDWIIVSLRAPIQLQDQQFCWYDIDFMNPDNFINVIQANQSLNAILDHILKISNHYGLAHNKTHLCGFSQGGILAYSLALKLPDLFQKVLCLSSYPETKILHDIVKEKKKLQHLRFFVSHGTDDAIIPIEWAKKGADLLYDLSCYFTFREYMNGHGINQKNYIDLVQFLTND